MTIVGDALMGGTPFSGQIDVVIRGISIPVFVIVSHINLSLMYSLASLDQYHAVYTITNNESTTEIARHMPILSLLLEKHELEFILKEMKESMRSDIINGYVPGVMDDIFVYICDSDRRLGYQGNVIYTDRDGTIHIGNLRGATIPLPLHLIAILEEERQDDRSLIEVIEDLGYNIEEKDPVLNINRGYRDASFF